MEETIYIAIDLNTLRPSLDLNNIRTVVEEKVREVVQ